MVQVLGHLYGISQKSPSSGYYRNFRVIMSTPSAHSGLINGDLRGLPCHQSLMPCIAYGIFQSHELILQMSFEVVANREIYDSSAFISVLHPGMFLSGRHQQGHGMLTSNTTLFRSRLAFWATISYVIFSREVDKNFKMPNGLVLRNTFITKIPKYEDSSKLAYETRQL